MSLIGSVGDRGEAGHGGDAFTCRAGTEIEQVGNLAAEIEKAVRDAFMAHDGGMKKEDGLVFFTAERWAALLGEVIAAAIAAYDAQK